MSIDTFEQVGHNCYDEKGNLIGRIRFKEDKEPIYPNDPCELRPVVDVEGEEVELIENVYADWREGAYVVMEQVNKALEALGVEVRFVEINAGDDGYHFGVEPL